MMLPLQDEATRQAGKEGRHAARELHKNARKAFEYWETIGNSMLQFRAWAMKQAGVQQLTSKMGSRYNYWFGKILNDYEMGPDPIKTKSGRMIPGLIKDGDRSILMNKVMPNIEAIKAWRNAQPETDRLRLNYPTTVHQKWLAAKKLEAELAGGSPLPADDPERLAGSSKSAKTSVQPHVPTMLSPDEKPEKVAPFIFRNFHDDAEQIVDDLLSLLDQEAKNTSATGKISKAFTRSRAEAAGYKVERNASDGAWSATKDGKILSTHPSKQGAWGAVRRAMAAD